MTARGEAIVAATAALNAASAAGDRATLAVAIAADGWMTDIDAGQPADTIKWDEAYLRKQVAVWRDAEQTQAAAVGVLQALLRTPASVVLGPLPADSEGGYLREWGAA